MAAIRPEGLSPSFNSLVSPYIPGSLDFEWEFRKEGSSDYQSKAQVYWYDMEDEENPILLKSYTLTGSLDRVHYTLANLNLSNGGTYAWRVKTTNQLNQVSELSELAFFTYNDVETKDLMSWESVISAGSAVRRGDVFEEIKSNLAEILNDYIGQGVEDEGVYLDKTAELFTGEIVPSRKDFNALRDIINFVAVKKEIMSPFDVIRPFKNGLGAKDIDIIKGFLYSIQMQPPQAPRNVSLSVDVPTMYDVSSIGGSTSGIGDTTIEVQWDSEEYPLTEGRVLFQRLSTSEDIAYYRVDFNYGVNGSGIKHIIYYRPEDLQNMDNGFTFSTNWQRIFTSSNLNTAKHKVTVNAIDKRGNMSLPYETFKTYGTAFKIPLGLSGYNMEYQKDSDPATKWYSVNGIRLFTTNTYRHNLGQNKFKVRYRIRTVDKTGMLGTWVTSSWIDFRGLVPPLPPKNLTYTSTYNAFTVKWQAGMYATSYELKVDDSSVKPASQLTYTSVDKKANTYYTFYVRSVNAVGKSSYVSIKVKTKLPPTAVKTYGVSRNGQSWRTDYRSYGGTIPNSSGWRKETTDVIQGRWEYATNTFDDWNMDGRDERVYAGMHNGNHRGLWFLDYADIKKDLAGKKIKSVQVFIRRESSEHGYPKDATPLYLWLHNYASPPSGSPTLFNEYNTKIKFDRGEGKWVTIPNAFVEKIVNGTARGFALHKKTVGVKNDLSYQRFDTKIQVKVTYYNY